MMSVDRQASQAKVSTPRPPVDWVPIGELLARPATKLAWRAIGWTLFESGLTVKTAAEVAVLPQLVT
ncbi:hypothetical protein D3C72_1307950 [compost metagenome]